MCKYYAFNLVIDSELAFPELLTCSNQNVFDVHIKWGEVSSCGLDSPQTSKGLFYQATNNEFWLHVPNVARFLVTNGNQIIIDPITGVDEDSLRIFILGSCMGALLIQRNLFLLHGNAIKVNNQCISLIGHSGAGKSTLSGAFFKRGYSILADDICAIDASGKVIPSFPQIKLWFDAAKYLNIDTKTLRKIRPLIEKFAIPLAQQYHSQSLPLKIVYILHSHNKDDFEFTTINGMKKLQPLQTNTYRKNYIHSLDKQQMHFKQCAQVAGQIELIRINRPKDGYRLNELADLIENDFSERSLQHVN